MRLFNFFRLIVVSVLLLQPLLSSAKEPLKVAVIDVFPPYCFLDENGKPTGFYVEVVEKMLQANKVKYKLEPFPWSRIVNMTDEDISMPWRGNPERFEKYNMIGPFTRIGSQYFFFTRKDKAFTWNTMNDLKGKTIGVVRSFAYPAEFEKATFLQKDEKADTATLAKSLEAGRVDVGISEAAVFYGAMKLAGISKDTLVTAGKPIETVDRFMVVPKTKPEVAKQLDAMFKEFSKTQEYRNIVAKYLEPK